MKATLVSPNGKMKSITINSYDEARQIVCNFDADGIVMQISCFDLAIILLDMNHKNKSYAKNKWISDYAKKNELINISDAIFGDVILIDSITEFQNLPYDLND